MTELDSREVIGESRILPVVDFELAVFDSFQQRSVVLDDISLFDLNGKTVNVIVEHPEPTVVVADCVFDNKLTGVGNAPAIFRKLNDRNVTRIRISFEVLGFDEDCERTLNFVELFRRRENRDGLCWECKLVSHVHRFCLDPNPSQDLGDWREVRTTGRDTPAVPTKHSSSEINLIAHKPVKI